MRNNNDSRINSYNEESKIIINNKDEIIIPKNNKNIDNNKKILSVKDVLNPKSKKKRAGEPLDIDSLLEKDPDYVVRMNITKEISQKRVDDLKNIFSEDSTYCNLCDNSIIGYASRHYHYASMVNLYDDEYTAYSKTLDPEGLKIEKERGHKIYYTFSQDPNETVERKYRDTHCRPIGFKNIGKEEDKNQTSFLTPGLNNIYLCYFNGFGEVFSDPVEVSTMIDGFYYSTSPSYSVKKYSNNY
jgi:hypothetical protein